MGGYNRMQHLSQALAHILESSYLNKNNNLNLQIYTSFMCNINKKLVNSY